MISKSQSVKMFHFAHNRFLKPMIINLLVHELRYLGPITAANVADELIRIFEENVPQKEVLKHGRMLWNALDKNTRGDSPKRNYKTVVLSVVTDDEITRYEKNRPIKEIRKQIIARIIKEAYQQKEVSSLQEDVGLIMSTAWKRISAERIEYEKLNNTVLPHTGVLHDIGSSIITHKNMILYKSLSIVKSFDFI
jgi:hypothetical protein